MKFSVQPSPGLYIREQVPDHFKELGIHGGYRSPKSTPQECILSIFKATNETFNFWTHIIPGILFSWQLIKLWEEMDFLLDPYAHPMFVYIISAILFPVISALAHIFNSISNQARHICFFMDYASLSLYSLGTAVAYKAYIFPSALLRTPFADYFMYIATVNATLTVLVSCQTRFMENGISKKAMRVASFAWPYLFDSIPIFYRMLYGLPEENMSLACYYYVKQFIFTVIATVLYISHVPERWFPGHFDILGHSHQVFHVCSVIATWYQMQGLVLDKHTRRHFLMEHNDIPSHDTSVLLMCSMAIISFSIMGYYTYKLYQQGSAQYYHPLFKATQDLLDKHGKSVNNDAHKNGIINKNDLLNGNYLPYGVSQRQK